MKGKLEAAGVALGWAVVIASVALRTLYVEPILSAVDIFILFLASMVAGALLNDVETVVFGLAAAIGVSILLMIFCLSLPGALGITGELSKMLYDVVIVRIFGGIFPGPFFSILLGGFFGSVLGERFRIH